MYELLPIPVNEPKIRIRFVYNVNTCEMRPGHERAEVSFHVGEEMNGYCLGRKDQHGGLMFRTPWQSDIYIQGRDVICIEVFPKPVMQ